MLARYTEFAASKANKPNTITKTTRSLGVTAGTYFFLRLGTAFTEGADPALEAISRLLDYFYSRPTAIMMTNRPTSTTQNQLETVSRPKQRHE